MTIKQQGGIFGRNPTFNDVDVDNDLSVTGKVTATDLTTTGDTALNNPTWLDNFGKVQIAPQATAIPTNAGESFSLPAGNISAFVHPTGASSTDNEWIVLRGTYYGNSTTHTTGIVFQDYFRDNNQYAGQYIQAKLNKLELGWLTNGVYGTTNATPNPALEIIPGGDVEVTDGNLVIGTSGHGIDFSATSGTGTSELFDDYEEGNFTPTLITGTGESITYTGQYGRYTKIGNQVTAAGIIAISAITAGSRTHMAIGGLPYATDTGSGAATCGGFSLGTPYNNTTLFTVSDIGGAELQDGSSSVQLFRQGQSGTSTIYVRSSEIQAGRVSFNLTYRTA